MAEPQLKTASVLAFERKLDPSDGLFSAGRWEDRDHGKTWPTVGIHEKSVRGTISNRLKATDQKNAAKLDASIQAPNLQTVDVAALPMDADTLRVRFTLRVLGGAGTPSACNNAAYQARLKATVEAYAKDSGFGELARRYAVNLANGRFLWRNRVGTENVEVRVSRIENGQIGTLWIFDGHAFSLRDFAVPEAAQADINALAAVIEQGLSNPNSHALLEVVAYARIGEGQEVYPSQDLVLDKGDKRGAKSKTLYHVGDVAALHSQKIGNALRTIDTWYPDTDGDGLGPIAVEPYGSVTSRGKAYRQPGEKVDFYNLLDAWVLKGKPPAELGNCHYVMANLVRGGVFGESEKD